MQKLKVGSLKELWSYLFLPVLVNGCFCCCLPAPSPVRLLADGCSSHMTAVAVGALGGYLNFYLSEQDITKRPLS